MVAHHLNILLLLGIGLFLGAIGGKLFQRLRIPEVVGYIVIGLIVGQTGLGLIPPEVVEEMRPLSMFALGLIGFMIGGELKLSGLRRRGWQFLSILVSEGLLAFLVVGVSTGMLTWLFSGDLKKSLAAGMLLGAISSATAPAGTVNVLWEYKTRGPLTNTILAIVALDDGLGLFLFSFAASIAGVLLSGNVLTLGAILGTPSYQIFASIALGVASAFLLNMLLRWSPHPEKQLLFTLGTVVLNMGLSTALEMDAILTTIALGATLVNLAPRRSRDAFQLIGEFAPPIYVLFFVLVGAELQVFGTGSRIWLLAGVYILGRTLGKMAGAYCGARMSGAPDAVRRYLGMGLFSQGGVAVGLSILAAHRFETTIGGEIIVVVTATTALVSVIGPPFVKLAVKKAGEIGLGIGEEDLIRSFTVADVMDRNPPVVRLDDRIDRILQVVSSDDAYLYYPVVDDEGELRGVVGLEDLKPILLHEAAVREILVAYDLMAHCDETVIPGTRLQEAINRMRETQLEFLPVVERNGVTKLVGFLDRRVLEKFLSAELLRRRQAADG